MERNHVRNIPETFMKAKIKSFILDFFLFGYFF